MEPVEEIVIPTTPEAWYTFIMEMRSIYTSNTEKYETMWCVFQESLKQRLKDI